MEHKSGELESISIEAAENGYMVMCRMCPPKAKKGHMNEYQEPERYVYETADAALKKVKEMLGGIRQAKGVRGLAGVGASVV